MPDAGVYLPTPPSNAEAEEYVLGALMLSPKAIEACSEILSAHDFYRESHARIWQACLDLDAAGDVVDAITVSDRLDALDQLEAVGGVERIRELATLVPAASNAAHHAAIVREHAVLRGLTVVGEQVQRLGWDRATAAGTPVSGEEAVGEAERLIFELAQRRQRTDFATSHEVVTETMQRLEERYRRGEDVVGLPSGFREIDRMTSGFQPGNLIVLAGRPSIGKTAWILCAAANVLLRHDPPVPVALFTMEMNRWEVIERMISSDALVQSERMRNGRLDREDWQRVVATAARLDAAPFFVEDAGAVTMPEVRSKARRLKLRQPDLGLVVVDYIQLMGSGAARFESRVQEVSQISRGLKVLAGELQVPVLALSQLSRQVEQRHDKRPILSDLRESGSIEQDSDLVLFIYRDEYYFPEDEAVHGIAEVNIAKHRNGPTGMKKLSFVSRFARFSDLAVPGVSSGEYT